MQNIKFKILIILTISLFQINSNLNAQNSDKKLSKKNQKENTSSLLSNQNAQQNSQQNTQQNNQQSNQQESQVISPNFISGDIVFIFNSFNTVELKATEVDMFLSSVEKLKIIVENPNFQKLTSDVPVKVDIEIQAAENILLFCNRITMTGGNVIRYKRFVNAIYEAAKTQQ